MVVTRTRRSVSSQPILSLLAKAKRLQRKGDYERAIAVYEQLVRQFGTAGPTTGAETQGALREGVEQALELFRWRQEYDRALDLLGKVEKFDPSVARRYSVDAAILRIARGDEAEGLRQLREMVETSPENVYLRTVLGAELIGLGRHDEAESSLREAASLEGASLRERGQAYWLLYELYRRKGDVGRAEEAWLEGCKHDPSLEARLADVVRAFIYWRHFDRASAYLQRIRSMPQRTFYRGLVELDGGYHENAVDAFREVVDDPSAPPECPVEYAEACLHVNRPCEALAALRPLVNRGEVSTWRLTLLGLAYGLALDFTQARRYLDIALRLADAACPRESRTGTGAQRILSGPARSTYGQIVTATDVRAELDHYFIPLPGYKE